MYHLLFFISFIFFSQAVYIDKYRDYKDYKYYELTGSKEGLDNLKNLLLNADVSVHLNLI